jgi:Na+/H+-dicarboxylate symporter
MAENEILQIVIFALVAGVAVAQMGTKGEPILHLAEAVSQLMLKMTGYVMYLAPVAVFAAVAVALAEQGADIVLRYADYVGGFYVALAGMWIVLLAAGAAILGAPRLKEIMTAIRQPALIAFTTASSEAVYPSLLAQLESHRVPNRIAALVLPLGYSFNLVGSMCYCTWASLFLVQVYDVPLTGWMLAEMLFMLFILSKGIAGVPRAGILIVAAVLPYFHIPEAGIVLILGVDHFVDMGRTATNAVANGLAAASVAKWEKA